MISRSLKSYGSYFKILEPFLKIFRYLCPDFVKQMGSVAKPINPKVVLYETASAGKLFQLKVFVQQFTTEQIRQLVNEKTDGCTPLLVACRNGDRDIVQYLVSHCMADIELAGSVSFEGETIDGAPPLWCASAAGHLAIVQFLVHAGANVNSTTCTNSTPLRAACFDGHLDVVQFLVQHGADIEVSNRHAHTCLMIACYKGHYEIAEYLLSWNANVNCKSVKGNTALHDCAESGNLRILKLLLEHGAKMAEDAYGMTPLLAASVTGHAAIVDYIINVYGQVQRQEIIDALELLGATFVDKRRNLRAALDVWKNAMNVRYEPGFPPIPKVRNCKKSEAYECITEAMTVEELEEMFSDPDLMRMQALVIRERILGPAHPDTSYYIRFRGAIYADAGKFDRCISLWNYALEMQQRVLEPLNPMTQSSFYSFIELFSLMMGDKKMRRSRQIPVVKYDDIIRIFERSIQEVSNAVQMPCSGNDFDKLSLQRVYIIALHLCCLLAKLLCSTTPQQRNKAHQLVYKLVSLNFKVDDRNILHLVCTNKYSVVARYPACQFPSAPLIQLLCKTGAKINERDGEGNTPLHIIGKSPHCSAEIVRILLDNGAHLDYADRSGIDFREMRGNQFCRIKQMKYIKLSCMAAKVVRKHSIPYHGVVPSTLYSFIMEH